MDECPAIAFECDEDTNTVNSTASGANGYSTTDSISARTAHASSTASVASHDTYNSRLALQRQKFLQSGGELLSDGSSMSCELALLSLLSKHGLPLKYYDDLMK